MTRQQFARLTLGDVLVAGDTAVVLAILVAPVQGRGESFGLDYFENSHCIDKKTVVVGIVNPGKQTKQVSGKPQPFGLSV